jgi:hypothetical protein
LRHTEYENKELIQAKRMIPKGITFWPPRVSTAPEGVQVVWGFEAVIWFFFCFISLHFVLFNLFLVLGIKPRVSHIQSILYHCPATFPSPRMGFCDQPVCTVAQDGDWWLLMLCAVFQVRTVVRVPFQSYQKKNKSRKNEGKGFH